MKDKIDIFIGATIVATLLIILFYYLINKDNFALNDILPVIIILILVPMGIYILWDRIKNIKQGLPAQDERLKLTNYKACYYGFIASIWSAVFTPLLSGILLNYEVPGIYVTAFVVLFGGLAFIISYLYLAWNVKQE